MTVAELKRVFREGGEVMFNNIKYREVSALICRKESDDIKIFGELLDFSGRSVTVAPVEKIQEVQ